MAIYSVETDSEVVEVEAENGKEAADKCEGKARMVCELKSRKATMNSYLEE